jgi:hypothetical protein
LLDVAGSRFIPRRIRRFFDLRCAAACRCFLRFGATKGQEKGNGSLVAADSLI